MEQIACNPIGKYQHRKWLQEWECHLMEDVKDIIIVEKYQCVGGTSCSLHQQSLHWHIILQVSLELLLYS